jgi:hypothetical protein
MRAPWHEQWIAPDARLRGQIDGCKMAYANCDWRACVSGGRLKPVRGVEALFDLAKGIGVICG